MSAWSHEQTLLFLKVFQSKPVIWDPNNSGHKDKKKVHDAWVCIQEKMKLPLDELKKKKDSLLATYRGYYRKKRASIKAGAGLDNVYRPIWFAYDIMDKFLGPVFTFKSTINTEENNKGDQDEGKGNHEPSESVNTVEPTATPCRQNKTVRRRANPPELRIASKQMTKAFNTLNNVINKPSETEDECDIFGKLIAKKLKKLPENEKEDLMFEIHSLFRRSHSISRPPSTESFCSSDTSTLKPHCSYSDRYNPFVGFQSTAPTLKRPRSETATYSNAGKTPPRPHSSFSEPPDTLVQFSNQSNETNGIPDLHIPEENTPRFHNRKASHNENSM